MIFALNSSIVAQSGPLPISAKFFADAGVPITRHLLNKSVELRAGSGSGNQLYVNGNFVQTSSSGFCLTALIGPNDIVNNSVLLSNHHHYFASLTLEAPLPICNTNNSSGRVYIHVRGDLLIASGGRLGNQAPNRPSGVGPDWSIPPGHWIFTTLQGRISGLPGNGGAGGLPGGAGGSGYHWAAGGATGGTGGTGGQGMLVGFQGQNGGNGGNGSWGATHGADDSCNGPPGNGGGGGTGGLGGMPGLGIFVEARNISILPGGSIMAVGGKGGTGVNGTPGAWGSGCPDVVGGSGGSTSAGGGRGTAWAYSRCWAKDRARSGGGGGGGGGRGAGGGGGGGGYVVLKARKVSQRGTIDIRGGPGGDSGWAGSAGANGYRHGGSNNCGNSDADAGAGGGGGGGGGQGGQGGLGALVVVSSDPSSVIAGNVMANFPTAHNITASALDSPVVSGYQFDSNTLVNGTDIVNQWLVHTGVRKIHSMAVGNSWFLIPQGNVKVGAANSNDTFLSPSIAGLQYYLSSGCTGSYQKAWPVGNSNHSVYIRGTNASGETTTELNRNTDYPAGPDTLYAGTHVFDFNPDIRFDSSAGVSLRNLDNFPLYAMCDGVNYLSMVAIDAQDNPGKTDLALLIDQYAPCDDTFNHACGITLLDASTNLPTGFGSNTGNLRVRVSALEGAGSGLVFNSATENNFKFFVVKQIDAPSLASTPWHLAGDENIIVEMGSDNTDLANITCAEMISGSPRPIGNGVGTFPSTPFAYNAGSNHYMEFDLNMTGSQFTEGTYWLFACFKDRVGNWSRLVDPQDSSLFPAGKSIHQNYRGPQSGGTIHGNRKSLSLFNPRAYLDSFNFETSNTTFVREAYIPTLHKRLIIDKSTPDDPGCASDPCAPLVLSPAPAFLGSGENNVTIAYSPIGFTNKPSVRVGIKLPFDRSGIRGVHYKIGVSGPNSSEANLNMIEVSSQTLADCQPVVDANSVDGQTRLFSMNPADFENNWVNFCFQITPSVDSNLYVWLVDNAGNNGWQSAFVVRRLLVDVTPPTTPQNLTSDPNPTADLLPTLNFLRSEDANGVESYRVCYWESWAAYGNAQLSALPPGSCPTSEQLLGRLAYMSQPFVPSGTSTETFNVPLATTLSFGRWDFSVFSYDNAGNLSSRSPVYPIWISDGKSRLDFTFEDEDFSEGGVSPRTGSAGIYTFRVRYTDSADSAPELAQVWIDRNGSGDYDDSEKFEMAREAEDQSGNNGLYWDGEIYTLSLPLTYPRESEGEVLHRFVFANESGGALDGSRNGDPTINNRLNLDPYELNFNGMMQVRNNVWRPGSSKYPTILLRPPGNKNEAITVEVVDQRGRLVRRILESVEYSLIDRYVIWRLNDRYNQPVSSGTYTVVYSAGGRRLDYKKIVVVK